MDTKNLSPLSSYQNERIFENMSDGIMTINQNGSITYMNSACEQIFGITLADLENKSFEDVFLNNKKNKAFNRLFLASLRKNVIPEKTTVKYEKNAEVQYLAVDISLIHEEETTDAGHCFPGMVVLFDDLTSKYRLKQHEHDFAYIFAGLIFCISIYLSVWSLLRFTLKLPLKTPFYTMMIEVMAFVLFLEIIFLTSLSLKEIGLIPNISRIKKNVLETFCIALTVCALLLLSKVILTLVGIRIKKYFIGGSPEGAYTYLFTAFIQEFLARGVIQTSVKSLMRVKYQKQFGILLTSLLFALMHLPFGFIFMVGALFLSLILGYLYERQKDLWGCTFLHWSCGYLAMCLFF